MSKQEEGQLVLKLYELRREETMRKARDWYFQFSPASMDDITAVMFGSNSGYLRMVLSYWDMAAGLVNNDAITLDLFNDTNGEHISVFSKIEPFLVEMRASYGPHYLVNFEKLIDATPKGRERTAAARERIKRIRAQLAATRAQTVQQN